MDYLIPAFANDSSNVNLQVGVDGRNSQASVSIPLAPHLQHLLHTFRACRTFLVSFEFLSSLALSRSWEAGKPESEVAGNLRLLSVCLPETEVKSSGLMAFEVACDTSTHPSIAKVCEEDHTLLFSFVIHSLPAPPPPPHVRLNVVLQPGEFFLAPSWIVTLFLT